jgi:hypothetical protein
MCRSASARLDASGAAPELTCMPSCPCGLQDLLAHLWWSHGAVEEFA